MNAYLSLAGRLLLAAIFLQSGFDKVMAPGETAQAMQSVGLSPLLLWPTVVVELGGAIALIIGWFSRPAALALAAFTVVAALYFHSNFGDVNQMNHFMKNIAIAGGLLTLTANGPGRISVSSRFFTHLPPSGDPLPSR